jgi:hypothetical protein
VVWGAGARAHAALRINQAGAALWIARAPAGEVLTVPDSPHAHVFIASGDATLGTSDLLATGDAARLTGAGRVEITVGPSGAEIVIWTTT